FFLENGDLFANFGYANIRPFFSRRIGLDAAIRYGARLSGKLNKDWRIGAMNIQTDDNIDKVDLLAQNYGVLTFQRKVFSGSNIAFMFINKQSTGTSPNTNSHFNRNVGLEYNLV